MAVDVGKARKILSESFLKDNEDINEDKAMELIVKAEMQIKDLEEQRDADDQLNAAKQITKDLSSGYSSAMRYEKAKIQYLIARIREIQDGVNPNASC